MNNKIISADHLPICLRLERYSIASSSVILLINSGLKVLFEMGANIKIKNIKDDYEKTADIEINRKMLAQLAIIDPATFEKLQNEIK